VKLIDHIRVIEDYPIEGISFKDISTLLKDPNAFREAIHEMVEVSKTFDFDLILAAEARGFIVGAPLAYAMGKGFVPIRKPGKLPFDVLRQSYELEYGTDFLEMHKDAIKKGDRVLIVDDLLATGGTSKAAIQMAESLGAVVAGCLYLVELCDLPGRKTLEGYQVESIVKYE